MESSNGDRGDYAIIIVAGLIVLAYFTYLIFK